MFKNREVKKLFLIEIIVILIGIIGFTIINNQIYKNYKKKLINNNAYIVDSIIKKYPDIEKDIIESISSNKQGYDKGLEVLKKYGLDDIDSLNYIDNNNELKNTNASMILIYISIVFFIMVIILFVYLKRLYNRIKQLSKYTSEVLNNRYDMDIREYDEGYISNLKNDLYKMTIKLREQADHSLKDKKNLEETLSDISHQLKTPLTSMYVINDLLQDEKIDSRTKKEFLIKNRNQLERIEWLVTSLLKISRLDSGSEVLKPKPIYIYELINRALEPLKIPIELKQINCNVVCDKKIKANLDLNWTTEVLINIIKNAYEHTNINGIVNIDVIDNPIYVEISIKDNGVGISKKDLPHVFERFYKSEKSNKDSIGIGLNMAKKIVELESGDIMVESNEKDGTTFKIRFYKNIF